MSIAELNSYLTRFLTKMQKMINSVKRNLLCCVQFVVYFRRKKEIDATNKNVVFLDETWVNKNHQKQKVWTDGTVKSRPNCKIGKGDRLIITHAGSKDGFVPNVLNIFWSNTGQADYHQDMNAEYFEKWFVEQLLVSLEEPSVIIIDNAKYHSRRYYF